MDRTASAHRLEPRNKGKLVGQKAPLRVKDIRAIRVRLQMQGRIRDPRCSTWGLTASSAPATWRDFASVMFAMAIGWVPERWFFS